MSNHRALITGRLLGALLALACDSGADDADGPGRGAAGAVDAAPAAADDVVAPEALLDGLVGARALVLHDGHAYVATYKGRVVRVPLDGGDPVELASDLEGADDLAVDGSGVYVGTGGTGTVVRLGHSPGPGRVLARGEHIGGVALDVDHVYWSVSGRPGSGGRAPSGGSIHRMSMDGDAAKTLTQRVDPATGEGSDLVRDPGRLAVAGGYVYFGSLTRVPVEGGGPSASPWAAKRPARRLSSSMARSFGRRRRRS